jgi:hypothetical protein
MNQMFQKNQQQSRLLRNKPIHPMEKELVLKPILLMLFLKQYNLLEKQVIVRLRRIVVQYLSELLQA